LFSGTKSITKVFEKQGYKTFTVDMDASLSPDLCIDILDITPQMILDQFGQPDIIWASPPCTAFSVAALGYHWTGGKEAYIPKTEFAKVSQEVVRHTLDLIRELNPKLYFIENPRGVLRKMPFMYFLPRYTVTYCQYGDHRMKPTDIWTNHLNPCFKAICKNGDPCHEAAPRGSKTGTQGLKNAKDRGVIPEQLCVHIAEICKR
jgi:site-specific DNA-cytosine methylase